MQSVGGHSDDSSPRAGEGEGSSTRQRILAAAEALMSEKGLDGSSISEFARSAGVVDSVIYQHFTGKQ
ncbi:MAG: TetR/AcrR family transcriptional regulator, partial [Deltaproteobacteria bacterium]